MSKPFITYKDMTLSFCKFNEHVLLLQQKFNYFEGIEGYILIKEDNPIHFYTLLFALWGVNKKVVFPNNESFNGITLEFIEYIVTTKKIKKNPIFIDIKLPNESDTILFSSGSTGKPKGILHKKSNFFNNAKNVSDSINVSGLTSVTLLKPYLVSALSHFLVHKLNKSHLIFLDIDFIPMVSELSTQYEFLSYLGSPMHIISMLPFMKNKYPDIFFSSGDIFYASVIEDILVKFPKTIFVNAYGMAELGGRIFINKIDKNNITLSKSIGKNINGIKIDVLDDEVIIKSELLFDGYIINNKFIPIYLESFKTGDKIIKVDEHYEFFGRTNDEIKVVGNKVSLKYIEQKISSVLPDIYTPIVISQAHNLLGNMVVLVLYIDNKIKDITRKEIISSLRDSMYSYEIPHKIYITNRIPYTQTMKIDRKEIVNMIDNMELLR